MKKLLLIAFTLYGLNGLSQLVNNRLISEYRYLPGNNTKHVKTVWTRVSGQLLLLGDSSKEWMGLIDLDQRDVQAGRESMNLYTATIGTRLACAVKPFQLMVIPALRISSDFIQGSDIRVAPMASTGIGFRRDDSSFVKIGVRVVSEAHGVTILPFSEMDLAAPSGWILSVYLPDHVTATKQIKERMKTGVKALYQINYSDITGLNDRYKMQGKHFATEMFLDWMPNKKALIAILAGYQWVSEYTSTQYAGNRKNNDSPSVKPGIIKANSVYCGVSVKFFSPERKNENPD